ncbi:hypothetical protein ANO11243_093900 [Dothideomycetidae sp. 11243]|nr:hypothetical protein ANO11243_093900 [fungal sp. No.11243]
MDPHPGQSVFRGVSSLADALHSSPSHTDNDARLEVIKAAFRTGWTGYEKYAWGADELLPVSNGNSNEFGGWGATPIDALSTAIIMNMPDVVEKILAFVPTIQFDKKSAKSVSLFESTIRFIGGLLSAYDLLQEPASAALVKDKQSVDNLLTQAVHLANNMSYAFNTPSGVPLGKLFLNTKTIERGLDRNSIAGIGTLVLEWCRLSDLTGNSTYAQLTQKAQSYLLDPQPASAQPFPGLVGKKVNVTDGKFLDATGGWGGSADSFYEYLIKMYIYDKKRFSIYKDRWILAADSTITHLTSHPKHHPELTFVADFDHTRLLLQGSHLACFHGGNFILGGMVLDSKKYIDYGLELVASCRHTYELTATGIGPDGFAWDYPVPTFLQQLHNQTGFYITGPEYALRPEVLESYYYAYVATGDPKYREWSWEGISAILNVTRVGSGYSHITNVNAADGGSFANVQESFFFAEVLKYAYLIHAPSQDAKYQVKKGKKQSYVFNTEAHPLRVFKEL